ncbi:histidyl-tRNA synthetase [Athelia psychrophila]|uniref:histidine--tRNA ligase n=1 Tax=Athelia psychrophila TaxID=1759441 RepID=A0A166T3S4_9AGAM|nr:histidyl-tRNA synthetase [Fibularhizoctonia sp. CBS 109695]
MATTESLNQEIAQQNTVCDDLRQQNAEASLVEEAKEKLDELKESLGALNKAAAGGEETKKKELLLLKTAKGTRDYGPEEMLCKEHIERIVKDCFTKFGGACIDTPVFERKDLLTDKYGEGETLMIKLMDQGGEQLALRYDHTVPLARYLAMEGTKNTQSKLWQVGKVYRRDSPVISKGRMREFLQADFDITGTWDAMIPDAEIISLLNTILSKLDVGEFTIKINHRQILDGVFEVCGVPNDKLRSISSAVDNLDKLPWLEVKKEMTEEKGLDPAVADKIGEYMRHKGGVELLDTLLADQALIANPSAKAGLEDMGLLFKLLKAYKALDRISFDMSLARGLDYYTGIIYEATVEGSAPPGFKQANALASSSTDPATVTVEPPKKGKQGEDAEEEVDEFQVGVGSIAGGGRYDNVVGMFSAAAAGEGKKAFGTPCIGVSIGLDRIFAIVGPKWVEKGMRSKSTMVFVMSAEDGLLEERIELVQELREAGLNTDFLAKNKPNLLAQFTAGDGEKVPFAIILSGDELKEGLVTVKEQMWELKDGKQSKIESAKADNGVKVNRAELIQWIKSSAVFSEWQSGKFV